MEQEITKKYKVSPLSFCDGIGVIPYVANKVCPDMVYTVAWEILPHAHLVASSRVKNYHQEGDLLDIPDRTFVNALKVPQ